MPQINSKFTTWLGVTIAVCAVFAENAHLLPESWRNVVVLASVVVAAIGKSLMPGLPVETSNVQELSSDDR